MYKISLANLQELLIDVIESDYKKEHVKSALEKVKKAESVNELLNDFSLDCYHLARNHSGIMERQL